MTCAAGKLLDRFLDGELPPEARRHFRRHLNECADCRQVWQTLECLRDRLESEPRTAVPVDIAARILARAGNEMLVAAQPHSALPAKANRLIGRRSRRWIPSSTSVASVAALTLVGLVLGALMSTGMRRESRLQTAVPIARGQDPFASYGLGTTRRNSPASLTDVYVTLVSGDAAATRSALAPARAQGALP